MSGKKQSRPAGNGAADVQSGGHPEHTRPALTPREMLAWAAFSADARGCTCNPDINVTETSPGIYYADIGHDDDCPALGGDAA